MEKLHDICSFLKNPKSDLVFTDFVQKSMENHRIQSKAKLKDRATKARENKVNFESKIRVADNQFV